MLVLEHLPEISVEPILVMAEQITNSPYISLRKIALYQDISFHTCHGLIGHHALTECEMPFIVHQTKETMHHGENQSNAPSSASSRQIQCQLYFTFEMYILSMEHPVLLK